MKLSEVMKDLEVTAFSGDADDSVDGVSCDSRKVGPGFIFAAVRGQNTDGHNFLPSAREGGANTVLSEQPPSFSPFDGNWIQVPDVRRAMALAALAVYGRPDRRMSFIGVTGTNGKTTTCYLLEAIFRDAGRRPALMGTVVYRFGHSETEASRTTPESPDVIAFARKAAQGGGDPFIMEVSSHSLSLSRVYGIEFDTVIFTNLSQDHLDFYPDLAAYGDAKRRLFDGRNGAVPRRAVFNLDDPFGAGLYREFKGEKYGTGAVPEAACRIIRHEFVPAGMRLTLAWQGRPYELATSLTGRGNLHNVTQAFTVAMLHGLEPAGVTRTLAAMGPIPGRMEEVSAGRPFRLFVDFAHKEAALANACSLLKAITPGRLIVVFGCGGDRDRIKRPRMGRVAAETADIVIITSDNPRTEDPEAILDEIIPGIREVRPDFIRRVNRREAIREAIALARPGDTILLAGKGHEREQIIGDTVIPFNDNEVALELLGDPAAPGGASGDPGAGRG